MRMPSHEINLGCAWYSRWIYRILALIILFLGIWLYAYRMYPCCSIRSDDSSFPNDLGAPCSGNDDCESEHCITGAFIPYYSAPEYPGSKDGYCSQKDCDPKDNDACGSHGICIGGNLGLSQCYRTCSNDTDCLETQDCAGICLPREVVSEPTLPDYPNNPEGLFDAILSRVEPDRLQRRVRVLSGAQAWNSPDGPVKITSRAVGHPGRALAEKFLESELAGMGYKVTRQQFVANGRILVNIMAGIEGGDPTLVPMIIGAHYDSTVEKTPEYRPAADPAPGASDNATGVAAVLEIADIMADVHASAPPPRGFTFVFFDGEELGVLGSDYYAQELVRTGTPPLCLLNIDWIGRNSHAWKNRVWLTYQSADESTIAFGLKAASRSVSGITIMPTKVIAASAADHLPFWHRGLCAVSLLNPDPTFPAHKYEDTADRIDWDFYERAVRSAAVIAAALGWHYFE